MCVGGWGGGGGGGASPCPEPIETKFQNLSSFFKVLGPICVSINPGLRTLHLIVGAQPVYGHVMYPQKRAVDSNIGAGTHMYAPMPRLYLGIADGMSTGRVWACR